MSAVLLKAEHINHFNIPESENTKRFSAISHIQLAIWFTKPFDSTHAFMVQLLYLFFTGLFSWHKDVSDERQCQPPVCTPRTSSRYVCSPDL